MGGKSSPKTSSTTTYENTDRRVVADGLGVGVSGDNNQTTYSVQMLDGGAIAQSADVVRAALETVSKADATAGDGFGRLLDLAGGLFEGGAGVIEKQQAMALQTLDRALEAKTGTIDNKTIMVGVIAAAVAYAFAGAKK